MKRNNKGFSLVELIVVVAILALIMIIGAISLNFYRSTNQKQAVNKIVAYMGKAQTEAMGHKDTYGVEFMSTADGCRVSVVKLEGENTFTVVGDSYTIPNNINVTISGNFGSTLMKGGNGAPDDAYVMTYDRTSGSFSTLYRYGSRMDNDTVYDILCGKKILVHWRTGKVEVE